MRHKGKALSREQQANREALLTLGAYGFYFLWWYAFAYGLGDGDPEQYRYVAGMPAWFFYSCVVGYLILPLALWIMIRLFFRDMPLDDSDEPDSSDAPGLSDSPADPHAANAACGADSDVQSKAHSREPAEPHTGAR